MSEADSAAQWGKRVATGRDTQGNDVSLFFYPGYTWARLAIARDRRDRRLRDIQLDYTSTKVLARRLIDSLLSGGFDRCCKTMSGRCKHKRKRRRRRT